MPSDVAPGPLDFKAVEPEIERFAIPLAHVSAGTYLVGSGFLGRCDGEVALYTAAHCLATRQTRGKLLEIDGWRWLSQTVAVFPQLEAASDPITLQVSEPRVSGDVDDERVPSFKWDEPAPGFITDAVRFCGPRAAGVIAACMEHFDIVDLDRAGGESTIRSLEHSQLMCVGFPPRPEPATRHSWPYQPASRDGGVFVRVEEDELLANYFPDQGFSGGPVFDQNDVFVGMIVGRADGYDPGPPPPVRHRRARIIPLQRLTQLTAARAHE